MNLFFSIFSCYIPNSSIFTMNLYSSYCKAYSKYKILIKKEEFKHVLSQGIHEEILGQNEAGSLQT